MRTDPEKDSTVDPFKDLTPTQKVTRKVAIGLAFIAVFIWLIKVIFGVP